MFRMLPIQHVPFAHHSDCTPRARFVDLLWIPKCQSEDVAGFVEWMLPIGDGFIQTIESTGPVVVEAFVERRGNALHRIAIEVDDIERVVGDLRKRGVRLVDENPRHGGMGTTIVFTHPSEFDGVLVELVQVPEEDPP